MSASPQKKDSNGGFAIGFILGIAIGAVIVFLIATKKGKRILRLLSEEGLGGLADLEEVFAEKFVEEKNIVLRKIKKPLKRIIHLESESIEEPEAVSEKEGELDDDFSLPPVVTPTLSSEVLKKPSAPARRFFRGIPKRG